MITEAPHRELDKVEGEQNYDATDRPDSVEGSPWPWMVSRAAGLLTGIAVVAWFELAATAAAQVTFESATVNVYTPERMAASTAVLIGLISAVIGGLALARAARRVGAGTGRRGAIVALVLGPIGLVVGALVVAMADGGLGTGNGIAGGIVAIMVGFVGMILGGLALARSRRTA